MKILKLALAASLLSALGACHKSSNVQNTRGIEASSGSYASDAANVPGTETDSSGVGATGVPREAIANPPAPDTPDPEAKEPTANGGTIR